MEQLKIGVLTGSLRKGSFSAKIARVVSECMARPSGYNGACKTVPVEIGGLALFNQDFDDEERPPREWTAFRQQIESLDGFLFVTPEYNRSLTPALKNALDIASRPYGVNRWDGKPGAIISVTPGKLGAFGAYHALRQVLGFLNLRLLQQPEMYISGAAELFNDQGELVNPGTRQFLQNFTDAFTAFAAARAP